MTVIGPRPRAAGPGALAARRSRLPSHEAFEKLAVGLAQFNRHGIRTPNRNYRALQVNRSIPSGMRGRHGVPLDLWVKRSTKAGCGAFTGATERASLYTGGGLSIEGWPPLASPAGLAACRWWRCIKQPVFLLLLGQARKRRVEWVIGCEEGFLEVEDRGLALAWYSRQSISRVRSESLTLRSEVGWGLVSKARWSLSSWLHLPTGWGIS